MSELLSNIIEMIKPLDEGAMAEAQARQDSLTKPQGSLGTLEELSIQIAGIKGESVPRLKHKAIITIAGDHGVVAEGVSLYPQEVTVQMILSFLRGSAGINVLANHIGARVVVVDMGAAGKIENQVSPPEADPPWAENIKSFKDKKVGFGTKNMAKGPAMSKDEAVKSIENGIEVLNEELPNGIDIVGTGDMGIGNTTSSSAICSAITGESAAKVVGRGTGIDDKQLAHKIAIVQAALEINRPNPKDPIDVLAKVGGFEIGGLAGVILSAAAHRIPVVIDGFISGAAALIAVGLSPQAKDYLIAAHVSAEPGHRGLLEFLGLPPLLNLKMRLGEGTGAALGIFLADAAVKILAEMATFAEAGVSEKEV